MIQHNNYTNNGIFVQAIDQGYIQNNNEKDKDLNEYNILDKLKFYDDLFDDNDVTFTPPCNKITFKKKKNKLKLLLKPKWQEKISLMKTNSFLYMKNYFTRYITTYQEFFIKICEILKILLKNNIKM
jgi:hypothetical protein